jgi:hypothetical protein
MCHALPARERALGRLVAGSGCVHHLPLFTSEVPSGGNAAMASMPDKLTLRMAGGIFRVSATAGWAPAARA